MQVIKKVWISHRSRWNSEKKEVEHYYECEMGFEGKEETTFEVTLNEEDTLNVFKAISPVLKRKLIEEAEEIPDELESSELEPKNETVLLQM